MDTPSAFRTRRSVLTAAAAAGSVLAAKALMQPAPVAAADVVLGAVNTATTATTIRNTDAVNTAVALKGLVTTTGSGGATAGVWGQSNAQGGSGVFGIATSGNSKGVWGRSVFGRGIYGEATGVSTTANSYGVFGDSKSTQGAGVFGHGASIGVIGSGYTYGVLGESPKFGVYATGGDTGVYGSGPTGLSGNGGIGVSGIGTTYGVYAFSNLSYAGFFNGTTHVAGAFSATTKAFLIDHPQDPAHKTLRHACVEAPEMLNVYRGIVILDAAGRATARLPRYFRALNIDDGYQLTAIGAAAPGLHVARKIERNSFRIAGGAPGQEVCWLVTGARQDAWAKANPLRVERAKRGKERGRYLNPEVHGHPASAAIHPPPKVRRRRRIHIPV